jgi:hypothetical protein
VLTASLALLQPSLAVASAQQDPQEPVTAVMPQAALPEGSGDFADRPAPLRLALPLGLFAISSTTVGTQTEMLRARTTVWTTQQVRPVVQSQGKRKAHSREYYMAFGMIGAAAGAVGGYMWITTVRKGSPYDTADAFKLGLGIPLFSFGSVGAIWAFWKAAQ